MSIIPANKSHYYVGVYDNNYDILYDEKFVSKEEVLELANKYEPYMVSVNQDVIGNRKINKVELNIEKIIDYYQDKERVNYYKLVPNYLKLPQAVEDKK